MSMETEKMIRVSGADGEEILVSERELKELGQQGVLAKYSVASVYREKSE